MPKFQVPVIMTVEATNYLDAEEKIFQMMFETETNPDRDVNIVDYDIGIDVPMERDNENQRVIYLHDENISLQEDPKEQNG
jgi:hypothetical protein